MAAPSIRVTVRDVIYTRREKIVRVAIQLFGTTPDYTVGGEVIDLSAAVNPKAFPRAKIPATPLRQAKDIVTLNNVIGYGFSLKQNGSSPTIKNYLLQGWNGSTQIATTWPVGTYGATADLAPEILFDIRSGIALG